MSRKFQQGKRNTELLVPPDKRRKTDLNMAPHCQTNAAGPDELWDDDDDMDIFTQDQLENIDNLIACSQQVGTGRPRGGATMPIVGSTANKDRLVGHGSTKSRSMGEPWSSQVSSFSDVRNCNQAQQWTRHSSASTLICQSSNTKGAYQPSKSTNMSTASCVSTTRLPPKNVPSHRAFPGKDSHTCNPSTASTSFAAGNRTTTPVGGAFKQQSFSPSNVDTGSEKLSQVLPCNEAQLDNATRQQVDTLLQECQKYRSEMVVLRESQQSNDGQVKILRASLTQKENELSRLRQEQLRAVEQETRLRVERESSLGKEIERLRTQLQFKEQEIVEVQGRCKTLEVRLTKITDVDRESGSSLPPQTQSPRSKVGNLLTSPKSKVSCLSSPRSKVTVPSPVKGAFPNEQSFLSEEKSPRPCCSGLQENPKNTPLGCYVPQKQRRRMQLKHNSRDCVAGPQLVDRLLSSSGTDIPGRSCHAECHLRGLIDLMQTPHSSHPASVSALQGVSSEDIKHSNLSTNKHPTPDFGQVASLVSNGDHLVLAKQALHELLSQSPSPDTNVRNDSVSLRTDTQSAPLILPLIEDCVDGFIASMDGKANPTLTSPATSLLASTSDSSVESINGSLGALSVAPPSGHYRHRAVGCALNALAVLNTMLTLSADVRHAVVCHVTSHTTSTQKGKGEDPCCHGNIAADPDPRMGKFGSCQLFKKLVDLANPLHFQNRVCCLDVTEAALVCLTTLAHNCHQQHLHRFESLVNQDLLVNCLADDLDLCVQSRCTLALQALDILTALVRSSVLLSLLCVAPTDECLLQLVYSCVCSDWKGRQRTDTTQLGQKVVTLLSTVVSHHRNGVSLLLTSNCPCGADVVKSVVLLLHRELHAYRATPGAASLQLLRDGVTLLHTFSVQDKYYRRHHEDVEHQYVELVCGAETLFRETDGVRDHEMAALLELWDFDQDCPNGSGEEDDEESKASDLVTGNAKDPRDREEQPMDVIEIE